MAVAAGAAAVASRGRWVPLPDERGEAPVMFRSSAVRSAACNHSFVLGSDDSYLGGQPLDRPLPSSSNGVSEARAPRWCDGFGVVELSKPLVSGRGSSALDPRDSSSHSTGKRRRAGGAVTAGAIIIYRTVHGIFEHWDTGKWSSIMTHGMRGERGTVEWRGGGS